MPIVTIHVEYLGVIRLLLKQKEDHFVFERQPSIAELLEAVAVRYGTEAASECRKQLFILYRGGNGPGQVVDDQVVLEDGNLLKIASLMTGG